MNNELAYDIKKYKRQIKANLLCSTKLSDQFLSDLSNAIDNYINENNITQFSDIQNHFGTPEQIAQSFFAETDIGVIRKKVRLKRIIACILLAALLIWGICVAISSKTSYDERGGYGVEYFADETILINRQSGDGSLIDL